MHISDEKELQRITSNYCNQYQKNLNILSFQEFLGQVKQRPYRYLRNSVSYLADTFQYFGTTQLDNPITTAKERFKLFDLSTDHSGPIMGNTFKTIFSKFCSVLRIVNMQPN